MYLILWIVIGIAISLIIGRCIVESQLADYEKLGIEPQPMLSDDEYLALLSDIPPEIALGVRDALVDATGWDREEIHPETRLIEFELS